MTDHKALPVKGYTDQNADKVRLVNVNKDVEERLLRIIDDMYDKGDADLRWLSVARTHFEEGFMALNRAVFQPERVSLSEDDEEST